MLPHHPREPLTMAGGTTFHFVTDGIEAALEHVRATAGGRDIRIGGGPNVIRQYLQAGLVDEIHLAVSPVILGRGEHLFDGIDMAALGFRVVTHVPTQHALHLVLSR